MSTNTEAADYQDIRKQEQQGLGLHFLTQVAPPQMTCHKISCWSIFFHIWPNGGGLRVKLAKPPIATLSSGRARNGGPSVMEPPGQDRALLDRRVQNCKISWETARWLSCCFSFHELLFYFPTGKPKCPPTPPTASVPSHYIKNTYLSVVLVLRV